MPSFQVPVLGLADGFLSPFPDSLPQLFLRCLPYAFALGPFRFRFASFRPLPFRLRLLGFLFLPFLFLPVSASQWLPQRLDLLPFGSRPLPLGFRFRFWLLSLRYIPLQIRPSRFVFVVTSATSRILSWHFLIVNTFF